MVDNEDRATWAKKVLLLFSKMTGLDPEEEKREAVGDLMANIGHYCDHNGLDFLERAAWGISIWDVEKREEENGEPNAMYPEKIVSIELSFPNQRAKHRYRLHRKDLPGKPDLVFGPRRKVIFVHGCFWHLHPKEDCLDARVPKSNRGYWSPKLARNVARDAEHIAKLRELGWSALVIWECETTDKGAVSRRVERFLR